MPLARDDVFVSASLISAKWALLDSIHVVKSPCPGFFVSELGSCLVGCRVTLDQVHLETAIQGLRWQPVRQRRDAAGFRDPEAAQLLGNQPTRLQE